MKLRTSILILLALVLVNILVYRVVSRWDMTDDKRYTISQPTMELLQSLEAPLQVTVLLDGELNSGFTRLKRAVGELIEEFSVYAADGIENSPISPEVLEQYDPIVIHERTHKGKMAQTTVYPYAILEYQGSKRVVSLLHNQRGLSGEENLNHSIENLEFAMVEAIRSLVQTEVQRVAFLEGHGELEERDVYDLTQQLAQYYQVDRGVLGKEVGVLDDYAALIIADPQIPFSEEDKYIIDQYIMQGGRVLWVLNGVKFSNDILSSQGFTPIVALDLDLNDMLFRYGVRITHGLVQDLQCLPVPVDVSADPQQPNWQPMPWTYAPLLLTSQQSAITKNVAQLTATMVSAVELVGENDGIKKEVLLATSSASKITGVPAQVNLSLGVDDEQSYQYAFIPVGVSLEGEFPSLFAHLGAPDSVVTDVPVIKKSPLTRQIVVAAGSSIRNEWQQNQPLPLGYDRYTQTQFGNRDFMLNAVLYLTDDEGWLNLRQKEVTLRLINDKRAQQARVTAQVVSIIIPLAILLLLGGVILVIKNRKYVKK
ncbi:MAG: gliding motility-associated ABC transporter substrate-binding protein GldG [Paludibacteraceae bacterium]|nr:gliding motility-associated ABC transporter substrate-binding protein GldG [Paludibacteraceae bacterium]